MEPPPSRELKCGWALLDLGPDTLDLPYVSLSIDPPICISTIVLMELRRSRQGYYAKSKVICDVEADCKCRSAGLRLGRLLPR
jgi:hypothetical protein